MIRMLLVTPYGKDANSYYRAIGPWSYLANQARQEDFDFEFDVAGEDVGLKGVAWDLVGRYDLVFFHRPCRDDDLTIMKVCHNLNVPIWVEYDDWLFDVPYWNPHAGIYHNPGLQHVISMSLACADVVSVTTGQLFEKFKAVNKNVVIMPNAYRSDIYHYREEKLRPRKSDFAWRGTNTHDADMMSVMEGWIDLPGRVDFYGGPTWMVLNRMRQEAFKVYGAQDPFLYMKQLYDNAPKVMLFPLVDCLFNRCKSNIAYQEAVHAGALCVAPDMPEWRRPGCITYEPGNALSFAAAAAQAFHMPEQDRDELAAQGFEEMKKLYDTRVVNNIRMRTLEAVLSPDFERNRKSPWDQPLGLWSLAQMKGAPKPAPAQAKEA